MKGPRQLSHHPTNSAFLQSEQSSPLVRTKRSTIPCLSFALFCVTLLALCSASAWGATDPCNSPTVGTGAGSVGVDTTGSCAVVITVLTVDNTGSATSFTVRTTGIGTYDGIEDILVGVQNSSGSNLKSLPLTSTSPIFGFDGDGPCSTTEHSPAYSWCGTVNFSGYEGPHNTFTVGNPNSGTVNFSLNVEDAGIPNNGSTWFALEGTPNALLASQTQTLSPGVQSVYTFGADKYKITPSIYSLGGESLTITEVPILKSNFAPPANFPNESCVPVADLSTANGADTCAEFQADCSFNGTPGGGDCNTLLYQLMESYDLPSDLPAIGGPDFLVVHGSGCPTSNTALAQSIFTDYSVTRIDPTTVGKGSGTGSCFEITYTPGAPAITSGTTTRFIGFTTPVVDTELNQVKAGSTRPLGFQWFDNLGNPITNLSWCSSPAPSPGTCTAPWVNLQYFGISCTTNSQVNTATDTSAAGSSGLQNLGGGNYQFNWKTSKGMAGTCATVQVTFDNGVAVVPAIGFQFN